VVEVDVPETRYAKSGEIHIAYQVSGEGPFDLVLVPPFGSNVELMWHVPSQAAFFRRLERLCRLIRFDKRGTGMSDRIDGVPSLETRMDDVRAVMDAVGSTRAALLGIAEGGAMSALFAATYPERSLALVLWGTAPRIRWAPDYRFGKREEEILSERADVVRSWTDPQHMIANLGRMAPSLEDESKRALAWALRHSASPGTVDAIHRMNTEIDVRPILPAIRVPTLVLVRAGGGDSFSVAPSRGESFSVSASRFIAEHVPGARIAQLPGADYPIHAGNVEEVVAEIADFIEVARTADGSIEPHRVLATVLFTDLLGHTAKAVELGPRWQELLREHNAVIRRELVRYRGREIDTAGDGFFASGFDGPARAIRCACAIRDAVSSLGLGIRVGVHTGECDIVDGKLSGLAVNIGARVAAQAEEGEVLVSGTVKDLVAGSGIEFDARGVRELKGLGEWPLFAVIAA
jgi:pimeloyl-ACP methyl ester carboxylesterase